MRLAPVPIRFATLFPGQLDELIVYCVESSRSSLHAIELVDPEDDCDESEA